MEQFNKILLDVIAPFSDMNEACIALYVKEKYFKKGADFILKTISCILNKNIKNIDYEFFISRSHFFMHFIPTDF